MRLSKKICYVVVISIISFIYSTAIGQITLIFSGIPAINYLFAIGNTILIGLALLLYNGERWLFLTQGLLITFLALPRMTIGSPFGLFTALPMIFTAFQGDVLFNSVHGFFEKRNKLRLWAIITTTEFYIVSMLLNCLNFFLFFTSDVAIVYVNAALLMLPILLLQTCAGGIIGHELFKRIKAIGLLNE